MKFKNTRKYAFTFLISIFISIGMSTFSFAELSMSQEINKFLRFPLYTQSYMKEWSDKAVADVFTFDNKDYVTKLKDDRHYFTSKGWKNFTKILKELDTRKNVAITDSKMTQIDENAVVGGRYTWKIKVPVTMNYPDSSIKKSRMVSLVIVRTQENHHQIGIDNINIV